MTVKRDKLGRFIKGNAYWLGKKGKKPNSGSFQKGLIPWNKGKRSYKFCERCGNKFCTRKGKITKPHQRFCSRKCRGLTQRGQHYGKKIYKTTEYIKWRKAVLQRDGYKCIWCRSIKNLDVDHIKPKLKYPKLVFNIDNGRTLCKLCHKKTKSYGKHL